MTRTAFIGIVAASVLLAAGCQTTENYRYLLTAMLGATEAELVGYPHWGIPNRVYEAGALRFLEYSDARNVTMPGTAPTYTTMFIGNIATTTATGGRPPSTVRLHCTTTFVIERGVVVDWRFGGNDCIAPDPPEGWMPPWRRQ